LMLDQVTDPHNVGAIISSACAFGAAGVVMQKKHAPALNGVLAKTACGAVEHVPVAFVTNLSRALEEFKEGGYFSYGLDERGEMDIGELGKKPGKCVLIMGAEGPGIRHLVKEHCDSLVRLPMHGPMPSINVSNAAAVALYAVTETA
jgi:23S rRNA (guanosine2251-2'-O)-methyltransferase